MTQPQLVPQPVFSTGGEVDAAGELRLVFRGRGGQPIRAEQVTNELSGSDAASAECTLRLNGVLLSPLVPTKDSAGGEPFIWVQPADELTVEWTGADPGAVGRMGVVYSLKVAG